MITTMEKISKTMPNFSPGDIVLGLGGPTIEAPSPALTFIPNFILPLSYSSIITNDSTNG